MTRGTETATRHFPELTLFSPDPQTLGSFYGDILGLPTEDAADGSVSVRAGESLLRLLPEQSRAGAADAGAPSRPVAARRRYPAYHFAFFGPVNGCRGAFRWLAERVEMLTIGADDGEVFRFPWINAEAVYFADPEGNVLEILCPSDAGEDTPELVSPEAVTGICEMGLPDPDPAGVVERLEAEAGLPLWNGNRERFAMIGHLGASLIVVPSTTGRLWLSSEQPCVPAPFELISPSPHGALRIFRRMEGAAPETRRPAGLELSIQTAERPGIGEG